MQHGHTCSRLSSPRYLSFSDLSQAKLRPAVILAKVGKGDWVLAQVTSKSYSDPQAVEISDKSFDSGSLRMRSYARPGKLFTGNDRLVVAEVGRLRIDLFKQIVDAVVNLLREGSGTS